VFRKLGVLLKEIDAISDLHEQADALVREAQNIRAKAVERENKLSE
jgi:hypothetical protein